jgi:pyridoxal phosphate-dependent aminotransferase EpsN
LKEIERIHYVKRIYLSPPHLDGRERELLLEAYDSNRITTLGSQVDAFEREMSMRTGISNAAALAVSEKEW